ncbi:MAG TPA: hypothetical protein VN257_06540, partial [Actinotalea sp.]|nr:hypothetical protein [Actinotalea sp.]
PARDHLLRLLVEGFGGEMASPADGAEAAGRRWADRVCAAAREAEAAGAGADAAPGVPGAGASPGAGFDAGAGAAGAGRAESLSGGQPTGMPSPAQRQLAALDRQLGALGFAPKVDPGGLEVRLGRCPFPDLARQRPEVVCAVHLGLARGVLEHRDGPLVVDTLESFVEPNVCLLRLQNA